MNKSLKSKFLQLVFISFTIVGLIMLIGTCAYYYFNKAAYIETLRTSLKSSIPDQARAVLISHLIPEQKAGLEMLLKQFKSEEGLAEISVIEDTQNVKNFSKCAFSTSVVDCISDDSSGVAILAPLNAQNHNDGFLFKKKEIKYSKTMSQYWSLVLVVIAVLFLSFMIVFFMIARLTSSTIPNSLSSISHWLEKILQSENSTGNHVCHHYQFKEINELAQNISKIVSEHHITKQHLIQAEKHVALSQIAAQVAHDIRSPLAALRMMTSELKGVEEDRRTLIRAAVQRIDDIANDLAGKKALKEIEEGAKQEQIRVELLSALVDSIVSEKRMQFRSKLNVKIEADLDATSYGLFARIHPVAFKRVLSNLVNNAVEAFGNDSGKVTVRLGDRVGARHAVPLQQTNPSTALGANDGIIVSVTDTGKGIPPEILPKLMQKGATFGKENSKTSGSGLGLYHARTTVEAWGGTMKIDSEVGKGTVVTITLPNEEAPDWFVSRLDVAEDGTVVVVDDDDSIHHVWRERFDSVHFNRENMFHFSAPEDVEFWHKAYGTRPNILYLFDYELLGSGVTGLDVIEKLGIGNNSILVTSHYEEEDIRTRCKKLGVRLLPKNLAGFVPIVVDDAVGVDFKSTRYDRAGLKPAPTNFSTDIVLIDDDEMVRTMWKVEARTKGKNFIAFPSPEDFFAKEKDFDKDVSIYIDSNLSDGLKGEDVAKDIHQKGFKRIYLATGTDKSDFPPMPWIKDIVGKDAPFGR